MADRSLDDIINESRFSTNVKRGRGRGQNNAAKGGRGRYNNSGLGFNQMGITRTFDDRQKQGRGKTGISGGIRSRLGNLQPVVMDAREKLIAKARQTDARVKLMKKAKLTDARARLDAKRVQTGPQGDASDDMESGNIQMEELTRTIPNTSSKQKQSLKLQMQNISLPQTQFTVRNTSAEKFTIRNTSTTNISLRKRISPPQTSASLEGLKLVVSNSDRANRFRSSGPLSLASIHQSPPPTKRPSITLRQRPAMDNPRLEFSVSPTKIQRISGTTIETGGPLRLASPTRSSVDGTRVIITNLQSTVTEDDIKELFGALGILKRVHMVKQGIAEVIYSKRESALKAISTYHNRELDGKAMQCRLDTSVAAQTVPFRKNVISDRFKTYSSDNNPTLPYRSTISASTVIELQDEIIDKVLFKLPVSTTTTSKPVIFTVKI